MMGDERPATRTTRLDALEDVARQAEAPALVEETARLRDRLAEGRFYVACLGQLKRGKSSLINAVVGHAALPVGVVPVTAAVTVVRHGPDLAARVRFQDGHWQRLEVGRLPTYLAEAENPGNRKGVTAVEIFVPSPLLAQGMCLVDTPGVGSASLANTAATHEFLPHVDAALVVLGVDPPISAEELRLVVDAASATAPLLFVLNKADRHPAAERAEVVDFTRGVLTEALARPVDRVYEVSATERLLAGGPLRDWPALVEALQQLSSLSAAALLQVAETRETRALAHRLRNDIERQREALVRPLEEVEAAVDALRTVLQDADRSLEDLSHRLLAVDVRLAQRFAEERDRFFRTALPNA